nr:hypothetical protein [Tanacetum cinerariifolium]
AVGLGNTYRGHGINQRNKENTDFGKLELTENWDEIVAVGFCWEVVGKVVGVVGYEGEGRERGGDGIAESGGKIW